MDGRLRLTIPAPMGSPSFRIDSPAGSVRVAEAGEYRVTILHDAGAGTQIELAVSRGAADLFTDEGSTRVRPGESAYASAGLLPSYTYAFNSASVDDFDRWADGQPDDRSGVSSQYLPPDMREYSTTFDEYGDWQYVQPYGYVWYPRVAAVWRPYYYGRWVSYPRYGWTWIGTDAFAWPTHHYGRWGYASGVWFWIPASHWAPAYVSWAYAPGYVSWCPLGFDNRPVVNIGVSAGSHYGSQWNAWTVVPATHFGHGFVPQRVVRAAEWSGSTHPAFQVRPRGPQAGDVAVPRYVNQGDAIVQSQTARPTPARRDTTAGIAGARSVAVPRADANTSASASVRSIAPPPSSIPVHRGTAARAPVAPGYRTAPPAATATASRSRQTVPMNSSGATARDAQAYAPRYQPNYVPPVTMHGMPDRTAPASTGAMRAVPRNGASPAPSGAASPTTPASAAPPATAAAPPPTAAAPARPAPARGARGGSIAVSRPSGRGGH